MSKIILGLLCGVALHTGPVSARLFANQRSAYIQSFLASCHARQFGNPANRDLLARKALTAAQIDAFCQCGAIRSADTLDATILEAFARNQDRQPLLSIIDQATRYCSENRQTGSR